MRLFSARAAGVLAGALLLSACGIMGSREAKLVCPASFIAPDTDKLAAFRPGGSTLRDVEFGVQMASINSRCDRADHGMVVDTKIVFRIVANDPAFRAGSFQYFVSVVDAQQNILTKRTYFVPFELDVRQRSTNKTDELVEHLPLLNTSTGGNYAIVAGLQLTEAQLKFNRAGSRPPTVAIAPTTSVTIPPKGSASSP
ncbi:MAG: hypothetical protein ACREFC_02470 [Stellaceae bacterium]